VQANEVLGGPEALAVIWAGASGEPEVL
jgi:hypothetical protein